jgi:type VI secretion system protein ImpL
MQEERDLQRRALLYRFPQQFAGLGDVLKGFLDAVFEPTRYEQGAQLRGVYFTSGTQEGNPIDRVMGALAAPSASTARCCRRTPSAGAATSLPACCAT